MQTQLDTPITRTLSITCFEVASITDNPSAKTVTAEVAVETVGPQSFTLWEGDGYDAIGQWTDAQARARISSLIISRYSS